MKAAKLDHESKPAIVKEATSGKTIFVLTGLVYSGKRADDRKIEKIEKNNKILPDASL